MLFWRLIRRAPRAVAGLFLMWLAIPLFLVWKNVYWTMLVNELSKNTGHTFLAVAVIVAIGTAAMVLAGALVVQKGWRMAAETG